MLMVQEITADLLKWIVAQAEAGHTPEAVLAAMRASGWNDAVARAAIERSKYGSPVEVPPPVAVPEPVPIGPSQALRTSDRHVQVLATMRLPRVVVLGNLLADEECDTLIELSRARLERSGTIDNWSGATELSEWRTSHGTFFDLGENGVLQRVEARIAEVLSWPVEQGEGMQVLRYGPGAEYRPHYDYFDPTVPGNSRLLKQRSQRVGTLVMYLNTPAGGGSTTFPDVGLEVRPIKGNALYFSYDRPHSSTLTLHGAAPVSAGEKWVATKWLNAAPAADCAASKRRLTSAAIDQ